MVAVENILTAAGASPANARVVAANLVDSDLAGRASHGVRQVGAYVGKLARGDVDGTATPAIGNDIGTLVAVDGRRSFGQVTGAFAAQLGIERARRHGIALVTISGASHFGRNARWPEQAAEAGIASIHFGHGFGVRPNVAPHGGAEARLGTNPIAFGVPGPGGEDVIFDFSIATMSFNTVKLLAERGESLPSGTAVAADGIPARAPQAVLDGVAALLPFGGFKGYGLAVFAEIFGGILAGGNGETLPGVNAMLSLYIDIGRIGNPTDYSERLAAFLAALRGTTPLPGKPPVAVPGDRSRAARALHAKYGLPMPPALRRQLLTAADDAGVSAALRETWHPALTRESTR